jgi:O-antigen ligase
LLLFLRQGRFPPPLPERFLLQLMRISLPMESLTQQKSEPGGDRFFTVFTSLFAFGVLIIGWGPTAYQYQGKTVFSFGGNTSGIIIPLFLIYGAYRLRERDFSPSRFWKDPLFFFSAFAALSPLWGEHRDFSLVKGYLFPALMGYWMGSYILRKSAGTLTSFLVTIMTGSVALMVARGMSELPFIPEKVAIMHSTAMHHTTIAMMILMALPLAIGMLPLSRGKTRVLFVAFLIIYCAGIFLVSSRIGWIAFFCLCIFYLFKLPGTRSKALAIGAPIILFGLFLLVFPHYMTRFTSLGNLRGDLETSTRLHNWRVAGAILGQSFIQGISFSNVEYKARGRAIDSHFQYEHPHNLFLQILVYCGIPGLMLFFMILWKIAGGLRGWNNSGEPSLTTGLEGGLLGLAVINCADTAFNDHRAMLMVFLLVALIMSRLPSGETQFLAQGTGSG